jgi:hypothetical protein
MARIALKVIADPGVTRSTLLRGGDGTVVFHGDFTGPVHACGACDAPLLEGVRRTNVVDLVLFCNACGAYNESPAAELGRTDTTWIEKPIMFPAGRYDLTEEITVHERRVMASERSLLLSGIGTPVRFER